MTVDGDTANARLAFIFPSLENNGLHQIYISRINNAIHCLARIRSSLGVSIFSEVAMLMSLINGKLDARGFEADGTLQSCPFS